MLPGRGAQPRPPETQAPVPREILGTAEGSPHSCWASAAQQRDNQRRRWGQEGDQSHTVQGCIILQSPPREKEHCTLCYQQRPQPSTKTASPVPRDRAARAALSWVPQHLTALYRAMQAAQAAREQENPGLGAFPLCSGLRQVKKEALGGEKKAKKNLTGLQGLFPVLGLDARDRKEKYLSPARIGEERTRQ